MDIQTLITRGRTERLEIAELRSFAAARQAFGDDAAEMLTAQVGMRSAEATRIFQNAATESRAMLASESRDFHRENDEQAIVTTLRAEVEARTQARNFVPMTQTTAPAVHSQTQTVDDNPVVTRESSMREWLTRRGAFPREFQSERVSLGRIVRGLATGKRDGMTPLEVRVMSEGSGAAGQFLVPEPLSASVIDQVRAASVLARAGLSIVPMTSETQSIARVEAGPTVAWKSENSAITPSDLTLGRVTFTARTLPVLVKMSVELFEDATNAASVVEREIAAAIASEIDRVGLRGSGNAPEPEGIRFASGVTITPFTDTGSPANAVPDDFDFLIDLVGAVRGANFTPTARIYNSALATTLAKLKDSTRQPMRVPEALTTIPEFITNAIPNTLGDGGSPSADDTTEAYVADFRELMLGMRTALVLEVSRQASDAASSAFTNMQVWIRAYVRCDFQLARPAAFAVSTGVQSEAS